MDDEDVRTAVDQTPNAEPPRPRTTAPEWRDLTPAERRVVLLLADGSTDLDIGTQLGVSEREVHAHLMRIFRKLGIVTRAQLAALSPPPAGDRRDIED